jgi:hypothetical protein
MLLRMDNLLTDIPFQGCPVTMKQSPNMHKNDPNYMFFYEKHSIIANIRSVFIIQA